MDEATLRHQIELTAFPAQVQVAQVPGPGVVLRVTAEGGALGLEVQVTVEATRVYGEGPAVATALKQLKVSAQSGLPPRHADGRYERMVFIGD
ncbi:hypothetical protein LAJ19_11240 [Deinococcus taeanensis]|uniref:hypothetical protein n=1 Tax=Deinococcus taeanensis TaxID=2737050 RepID=UPI001CDC5CF3|nr:hypothetical protein [Deinococcus taeanensis]UBV42195.1 hypothetical protein LAJ19_11240 [Deinococcus taeanensis]